MKLVSEQSDRDLAAKRAEEKLGHHLREVAANLMRCARGAGKPWDIEQHIGALSEAFTDYREATGHGVPTRIAHAHLDIQRGTMSVRSDDLASTGYDGHAQMLEEAEEVMLRGALQVVASRMVGQPLQEGRGKDQMLAGVRMRDEAIAERKRPRKSGPNLKW